MTYSQTAPDTDMNYLPAKRDKGSTASWTTWATGGAVTIVLASFMPLIHQTNAGMLAELQVKSGVSHTSLVIGILVLGMIALARYRPASRLPVGIISLGVSLPMLGLYTIVTVAGVVGINQNVGFGISERLTWLPSFGMVFSGLGYAAIVLACVLLFRRRTGLRAARPVSE